jgi:ribonuclease-3
MTSPLPVPSAIADDLQRVQEILGHRFADVAILAQALTHSSVAKTRLESNERLEMLGDAVLGVIVCDELFHRYREACEGEMTRIKSVVVSREVCGRMTRKLGLDEFIRVGKGISSSGQVPESVEAAVMEAIIGAMYIDGGLEAARPFVLSIMTDEIDLIAESESGVNHKSLLQQFSQRRFSETPSYIILDEKGPDHAKCFLVSAMIGSKVFAPAWGPSKKEAEQRAAENAMSQLDGGDPVYETA